MTPIFKYLDEEQARTCGVLLAAGGIRFDLLKNWLGWNVVVDDDEFDDATDLLEEFIETRLEGNRLFALPHYSERMRGYGIWGALVLLGVHLAVYPSPNRHLVIQSLGASSTAIMQGEIYRSATALLIHASHLHLAGNMAGLALFGSAVCSIMGPGAGWLLITLTGIGGNLLNAWLYGAAHLSVGSSTAVFGAIGILACLQFVEKIRRPGNGYRALMPLGGGVALLAILGSGPHTDIMAHLFGFLTGSVIGFYYAFKVKRLLQFKYQILLLILTSGLLAIPWFAAPP